VCSLLAWWLVGGCVTGEWGECHPYSWACRSARLVAGVVKDRGHAPGGLPAREPEAAVLEQLPGLLRARGMVVAARAVELDPTLDETGHGRHDPAGRGFGRAFSRLSSRGASCSSWSKR
jgi:hypothetical protein